MENNQPMIKSASPQPPNSTSVAGPTPSPISTPNSPTGNVVPVASPKKRKKGLIAAIISIVAVLLIGGGAFAAAYFINNQPANIVASAMNNLFNAKQAAINGTIDLTLANGELFGVDSVNITFDEQNANVKNSSTAVVKINFTDSDNPVTLNLGEVMLENGTIYVEAGGLEELYDSALRDSLKTIFLNQALYGTQSTTFNDCYSADGTDVIECVSETTKVTTVDPAVEAAVNQAIDEILDQISSVIASFDNQWIEISASDILNSEMLSTIPESTRQSFTDSYNCTISTLNNTSNYAGELSDLYQKNPFINMTSGQNSFYNISFDAANLAGFINGAAKTKLASDLAACYNTSISADTNINITADDISQILDYFPTVSAKFDGIFNHHLTELKLNERNDDYTLSADLKFSYPNTVNVSTPNDYRPVMDVVNEVFQKVENLSGTVYAS